MIVLTGMRVLVNLAMVAETMRMAATVTRWWSCRLVGGLLVLRHRRRRRWRAKDAIVAADEAWAGGLVRVVRPQRA